MRVSLMQRGYLSSRDILLNSLFGEANNDNAGATMVWEWIAWPIDDSSYSFSVYNDGSNSMRAQINYMNSKVLLLTFFWISTAERCTLVNQQWRRWRSTGLELHCLGQFKLATPLVSMDGRNATRAQINRMNSKKAIHLHWSCAAQQY